MLSKTVPLLANEGLGDIGLGPIRAQLKEKGPQQRHDWDNPVNADTPKMEMPGLGPVWKNPRHQAGAGTYRPHSEFPLHPIRVCKGLGGDWGRLGHSLR